MTHGLKAFALVVLLFGSFAANAVRIVNTGPGPEADGGYIVSTYQSLAGEFSTKRAFEIAEIEGWMAPGNGSGTVAIYTDGGDMPGSELFSATFTATGDRVTDWHGARDLSWYLPAGTYWVSFEVRSGQGLFSAMPGSVENPLERYAFYWNIYEGWRTLNDSVGVRITGRNVPEPGTLVLLGTGLLGLAVTRRRSAGMLREDSRA